MHQIIMVVAAGLREDRGRVVGDTETKRVCEAAAKLAGTNESALVYATAGFSNKYGVTMGEGPMKGELLSLGIQEWRIRTPKADSFDTDGEMRALVESIPWNQVDVLRLSLVCRWWHMPRAWTLLQSNLCLLTSGSEISVVCVPVKSSVAVMGILREVLAWIKNALKLLRFAGIKI